MDLISGYTFPIEVLDLDAEQSTQLLGLRAWYMTRSQVDCTVLLPSILQRNVQEAILVFHGLTGSQDTWTRRRLQKQRPHTLLGQLGCQLV